MRLKMNCCDIVYQSDLYGINHKFRLQRICLDTVFLLRPPPPKKNCCIGVTGPWKKGSVGRDLFIYFYFFVCVRNLHTHHYSCRRYYIQPYVYMDTFKHRTQWKFILWKNWTFKSAICAAETLSGFFSIAIAITIEKKISIAKKKKKR